MLSVECENMAQADPRHATHVYCSSHTFKWALARAQGTAAAAAAVIMQGTQKQHIECLRNGPLSEGSTSVSCLQEVVGASQQTLALQAVRQYEEFERSCFQQKHLECIFTYIAALSI